MNVSVIHETNDYKDYSYESVAALTAAEWSYLTFEQALEDVVFFANHFSLPPNTTAARKLQSSDALQASQTPWIFIGGSYSGVRGSTLRIRNPEMYVRLDIDSTFFIY